MNDLHKSMRSTYLRAIDRAIAGGFEDSEILSIVWVEYETIDRVLKCS